MAARVRSAGGLTVVDGAMDALDRLTSLVVRLGDAVAVEEAAFPPLLDLLEAVGARTLPLAVDDEGVVPAALEAALHHRPVALFLQPRAHNPLGIGTTLRRARDLARVLSPTRMWVIEDDHAGEHSHGLATYHGEPSPRTCPRPAGPGRLPTLPGADRPRGRWPVRPYGDS